MPRERFSSLADCGPQVRPRVQQHKRRRITQLAEEPILRPSGHGRCARELDRPQMMFLDAGDETARQPTQSKAVAQASEDRQTGLRSEEHTSELQSPLKLVCR